MDHQFERDSDMPEGDIHVRVCSQDLTRSVQEFLAYLDDYQTEAPTILPIKTADRIKMLKIEDLILVEVEGTTLRLATTKGDLVISDRLYRFQNRLNNSDFVQVSKHSLLNINHLEYLEDGFSGTMTAFLSKALKTSVSRKYLKDFANRLGL